MAKSRSANEEKGQLVEEIAALLHRDTGVDVETRVKLPSLRDPSCQREIDVLLSTHAAGYPVRFAIECKNERKPIGIERIDAFLSKLADVGIPYGIYVSASGYTKPAVRRAKHSALRLLELRGLSGDRLRAAVDEALQSLVFLVPEVAMLTRFIHSGPEEAAASDSVPVGMMRVTIERMPEGGLPGIHSVLLGVWHLWRSARLEHKAGEQHCFFDLPPGFRILPKDEPLPHGGMLVVTLRVGAAVFSLPGKAQQFALVNAETQAMEKLHVAAEFEKDTELTPVRMFLTEQDLAEHLEAGPKIRLVVRVAVPRLIYESFYWPVGPQAIDRLRKLKAEGKPVSFQTVEGMDLSTAWEIFDALADAARQAGRVSSSSTKD